MQRLLFLILLALATFCPSKAQTAPTAPTTTNTPVAAPLAIPLGEIITQADQVTARLNDMEAGIAADKVLPAIESHRKEITERIDRFKPDSDEQLEASPSLATLRTTRTVWETISNNLADLNTLLSYRNTELDTQLQQLSDWTTKWQATLAASTIKGAVAPPEIIQRINDTLAHIAKTTTAAKKLQNQILSAQTLLSDQIARVKLILNEVDKKQKAAVDNLFVRDTAPLWEMSWAARAQEKAQDVSPVQLQLRELSAYAGPKRVTFGVHFFIFLLLVMVFYRGRHNARLRAKEDPAWQHTARIFDAPVATALLTALVGSYWLYPHAPRLFYAIILAATLIPAVVVLRRLIDQALFPVLYAMVCFFFVDQWRKVVDSSEVLSRSVLLVELIAAVLFVLFWLSHSARLAAIREKSDRLTRFLKLYAHTALLVFLVAGMSEILGYSHLAVLLGDGMFESIYLAIIFYAAVRIFDGLTMTALALWPFEKLGMVRRHYFGVCQTISLVYSWFFGLFWLYIVLEIFSLRLPLIEALTSLFSYTIKIGADPNVFTLAVGLWLARILAFCFTIWASFLISKFIRFLLDEEVYPHLHLAPGVPYAASTMVHYAVLLLGFYGAVSAMGQDLTQFAILASAFGVGLGFGLQNIFNNFISGLILLFERPIKRGDVLQLGTDTGVVETIGIRASVIRLDNGAEIIVPNGNLISNQVTNWTLSDSQRVIQIPVTVSPKADLEKVIKLLTDIATAHHSILKTPPPEVLLTTFTPTAVNFELHVWIRSYDEWKTIRSDLSLAISLALVKESIPLV